jgi:hypothetical protein
MMDRRKFLKNSIALAAFTLAWKSKAANALLNCTPFNQRGIQSCRAEIQSNLAVKSALNVGGQHLSNWCWAACIQMIFDYYGYQISQERLVQETWGSIVNMPGSSAQIVANLNRSWTDDSGRVFSAFGDPLTANAYTAAQDLSADRPLIIGALGHAIVLTAMDYQTDTFGNFQPISLAVWDPWPGNGFRYLSFQESFSINFLSRIQVWSAENAPNGEDSGSDGGGSGCFIQTMEK